MKSFCHNGPSEKIFFSFTVCAKAGRKTTNRTNPPVLLCCKNAVFSFDQRQRHATCADGGGGGGGGMQIGPDRNDDSISFPTKKKKRRRRNNISLSLSLSVSLFCALPALPLYQTGGKKERGAERQQRQFHHGGLQILYNGGTTKTVVRAPPTGKSPPSISIRAKVFFPSICTFVWKLVAALAALKAFFYSGTFLVFIRPSFLSVAEIYASNTCRQGKEEKKILLDAVGCAPHSPYVYNSPPSRITDSAAKNLVL